MTYKLYFKLSIITVNLNNRIGLEKTIQSTISQKDHDFEHLIIDGGSDDGSLKIIKQYSKLLHYWECNKDNGKYHAMNKGIRKATGKYCLFLNSGDYLFNDMVIENVLDQDLTEDIIYGQQLVFKNNRYEPTPFLDPEYISLHSFLNSTLPHQSTLIKRELFSTIGLYNESNRIVSDWEFNLVALFKHNCTIRKLDIPISVFDTTGISNDDNYRDIHNREKIEAIKKHFPRIYTDYEYFLSIQKRYLKIPKIVRKLFKVGDTTNFFEKK